MWETIFWITAAILGGIVVIPLLIFAVFILAKVIAYGYQAGKRKFELDNKVPNPGEFSNGDKTRS